MGLGVVETEAEHQALVKVSLGPLGIGGRRMTMIPEPLEQRGRSGTVSRSRRDPYSDQKPARNRSQSQLALHRTSLS